MQTPAIDIIQFMTKSNLRLYKKRGSKAAIHKQVNYEKQARANKLGITFVSASKEDLSKGIGYVVSSYETLNEQKNSLTHWTPNTFRGGTYYDFKNRIIKGHTRENLRQINVIGFDIDTKDVDLYSLFLGCDELGLPRPNLLLETPRGYQGFFVLETPFYITNKTNYKAIKVAEKISDSIHSALKRYVPVDGNCSPFGFYRIPNDNNVIYFSDHTIDTGKLITWSKNFEHMERKSKFSVIYNGSGDTNHIERDWYKALLNTKHIHKGLHGASRNNTLLTLAIANYASDVPYETAYDELDIFNSSLEDPLPYGEFKRTIKSAYSGKYKAPKRSYVEGLLEAWTNGKVSYGGQPGWYKFKKERKDRTRSHYSEWEEDICYFLNENTQPDNPMYECSLRDFAEILNIPYSTLKVVIKKSKKIIKKTVGKGRAAATYFTTRSMLIRKALLAKQSMKSRKQLEMCIPHESEIAVKVGGWSLDLPVLKEIDHIANSGSSPPYYSVV